MGRHGLNLSYRTVPLSEITADDLAMDVRGHGLCSFLPITDDLELLRLRHPDKLGRDGPLQKTFDQASTEDTNKVQEAGSTSRRQLRLTDMRGKCILASGRVGFSRSYH